jgi:GNAT superfamily N-acetyltransferase
MQAQPEPAGTTAPDIRIRPLLEADLPVADHIMRLSFGTFLGLPEPESFLGDAGYVHSRWRADSASAYGAEIDGELVGSNFATSWGSIGFFGPLTVRPDWWDKGVGTRLMAPVMECFERWGTKHPGLFTFAHSQKHIWLYQKFGFWPRFLTAIMSKPVEKTSRHSNWMRFSEVPRDEREGVLRTCRGMTDAVYEGLDLSHEIRAIARQGLGDTVLLWEGSELCGLAVCHVGPGSEAGSGTCYIKFGAIRPQPAAGRNFSLLLDACEEMSAAKGLSRLTAGVNTARHEAYRQMLERGFRTELQGVAMQKPNAAGYNRTGIYLIDDWR